jgi:hypothetical protein
VESDPSGVKFEVGGTFKLAKGLPRDKLYRCHILAIVDEDYVVYKWYGKHKQWWHYEVERKDFLEMEIKKYI